MPERPLRSLTTEEVEDFERDGVICARGLFAPEWIERMGAAAENTVFLDDFQGNLDAAAQLGIRGILVESDYAPALDAVRALLD